MRTTIGEYLIDRLRRLGVTEILGVPGDFNLNWIEQIDAAEGVRFVGTCNELNAAYAADGYARVRGVGALLTTYGVGELSAVNGIAGSAAEHVPVISIAGAPPLFATQGRYSLHHSLGDGNFENMLDAVGRFTAAAVRLTPMNAVEEIDRVLHACIQEQRPVHIQLPSDISHLTVEVPETEFRTTLPTSDPERLGAAADRIVELLQAAERPVFLVDQDAARHGFGPDLQRIAQAAGVPYAHLSSGRAILDEQHPLYLGTYVGAGSAPQVREAVEGADFLLTTTPVFVEANSGGFSHDLPGQYTVDLGDQHVSVGEEQYLGLTGAELLAVVRERVEAAAISDAARPAPAGSGTESEAATGIDDAAPLTHARLWPRMVRFLRERDVVIAEAGTSNIGLGTQKLPTGCTYINSAIWGSIGYTLPALLGSGLAAPERRQVLFIGDGSFQLTVQELSTILREGQKPVIVLLNNAGYTIERYILGMESHYNDIAGWDYAALPGVFAPGTKMATYRAGTEGELEEALAAIEAGDEGAFLELRLDPFDAPAGLKAFGPQTADFDYGPRGPRND